MQQLTNAKEQFDGTSLESKCKVNNAPARVQYSLPITIRSAE